MSFNGVNDEESYEDDFENGEVDKYDDGYDGDDDYDEAT